MNGDEFLIGTIKQGDQVGLGALYTKYFPKVYQTCYYYSQNREDAFDLAQDVLLKAFSKIGSFQGASAFSTWLFSITRNHCISQLSLRKRISFEDIRSICSHLANDDDPDGFETRRNREQSEMELHDYLKALPLDDRRILELRYYDNYSVRDLQSAFSLSASAVKMRLLRARSRMEQILGEREAA
jgi:RNA polymerase sigma factor (sigma-70 family)